MRSATPGADGWTFEAVNDGPSGRRATGTLRFIPTKTAGVGSVIEFRLDEHGQTIKGVLNRYSLAKSKPAISLLRQFDHVFFGGNVVTYTDTK